MAKKESQKYQEMLREVEAIVQSISGSDLDLDDLVERIERGYELVKSMRERLEHTKMKIDKLRQEYSERDEDEGEDDDGDNE
jgi:exodeoxyribonuclease VII small subunit